MYHYTARLLTIFVITVTVTQGEDWKNQIHQGLSHITRWRKVKTHIENYNTEHLPSVCIHIFSFTFFLQGILPSFFIFVFSLSACILSFQSAPVFPPFLSPPYIAANIYLYLSFSIVLSLLCCFAVSLWKTASGMQQFIPSLVLCHHDWSLSTTWNQKIPIKPAAACFMCVQKDCPHVWEDNSGWHFI